MPWIKRDVAAGFNFFMLGLVLAATARADSNGPPDGAAGNPPGYNTCCVCHSSFPLNSGSGSVNVQGLPSNFLPGKTYRLTIRLQMTGAQRWGFEATALDNANYNSRGGQIAVTNHVNTQLSNTGGVDYLKQTSNGTYFLNQGPVTWNFNWTAPSSGVNAVGFYVAGNAANADGSHYGDHIYSWSTIIPACGSQCSAGCGYVWTGPWDGNWANPGNWNPIGTPSSSDIALVANLSQTPNECVFNSAGYTPICGLTIGGFPPSGTQFFSMNAPAGSTLAPLTGTHVILYGDLELNSGILAGGPLTIDYDQFFGGANGQLFAGPQTAIYPNGYVYNDGTMTLMGATISATGGLANGQNSGAGVMDILYSAYSTQITASQIVNAGLCPPVSTITVHSGVDPTHQTDARFVSSSQSVFSNLGDLVLQSNSTTHIYYGILNSACGQIQGIGTCCLADAGGRATLIIDRDLISQDGTSLSMTDSSTIQLGGKFDIGISSGSNFDFRSGRLKLVGDPALGQQEVEMLAADAGAGVPFDDPARFGIGLLDVGPTTATVKLVNHHGPSGQVLYAHKVALESGITLDLAGCKVYYETLSQGSNVHIIDTVGGGALVPMTLSAVPSSPGPGGAAPGTDGSGSGYQAAWPQAGSDFGTPGHLVALGPITPNPASGGRTSLTFWTARDAHLAVRVFSIGGQLVARVIDADLPAGQHVARWDGRDASGRRAGSGIYYYEAVGLGERRTSRIAILR